jgi:hypothetical protein
LVAELEELGELEIARNRGRNRSNLYRIPLFNGTQGDIAVEENVTTCHILEDPSYVDDEFVQDGDSATSDEFVPELKCDILSDQSEILSGSNLKSCQGHGDISATSNHQEPSREPSLTIRERYLTIPDPLPEWYEILTSLDHWGGWSREHCWEWLNKNQLTERRALKEASGLRTWLDDQRDLYDQWEATIAAGRKWVGPQPKPHLKDPWRRFMSFMLEDEKNGGRLPKNNIPPTIAMTDGVDKFEIARQEQIARQQEG